MHTTHIFPSAYTVIPNKWAETRNTNLGATIAKLHCCIAIKLDEGSYRDAILDVGASG
jgi:hypothetical protein